MKEIEVQVKGTAPLLMHRYAPEDNKNETAKSSRGKKVYDPKEEAEKAAYRTEDGKLCLLGTHFKGAMIKSGSDFILKGKKTYKEYIKAGVLIKETEIVLDQQDYEIHAAGVVVSRSRITRWRPMLKEWSCKFTIQIIDEEMIGETVLKDILNQSGKYRGVGDNRPEYGRFEIVNWKAIK